MHADRKCCDPQEPPKPRFTESSRNGRRRTIDEMQTVLDQYLVEYNTKRPHQGRGMNGARRLPPSSMVLERRIPQYQTRSAKPPNPCPPRRLLSADYPLCTQYGVLQILERHSRRRSIVDATATWPQQRSSHRRLRSPRPRPSPNRRGSQRRCRHNSRHGTHRRHRNRRRDTRHRCRRKLRAPTASCRHPKPCRRESQSRSVTALSPRQCCRESRSRFTTHRCAKRSRHRRRGRR